MDIYYIDDIAKNFNLEYTEFNQEIFDKVYTLDKQDEILSDLEKDLEYYDGDQTKVINFLKFVRPHNRIGFISNIIEKHSESKLRSKKYQVLLKAFRNELASFVLNY